MKKISEMSNEEIIRLQLEQTEKIRRAKRIQAWLKLIFLIVVLALIVFFISKCVSDFNKFDLSDLDNVTRNRNETEESIVSFLPSFFK